MKKYDFINELLTNNNINQTQKERFFRLVAKELEKPSECCELVLDDIRLIKEKLGIANEISIEELEEENNEKANIKEQETQEKQKNTQTHNPKLVTKYLNKFKENTPLKWATHAWDENKFETIESYIESLNDEKGHQEIFNINRNLYNLVNYFLYKPNTPLANGIPRYGWQPGLQEMKIGWQFPNSLLIKWCKENFDNKSEADRKFPFQFILPEHLKPKRPVKGKMINTFENVVDVFKTEIQFRDNYLYQELKKRKRKVADYEFEGIEDFKNIDFYTYTRGLLSAIDRILEEVKENEMEKKLILTYRIIENNLFIDITHFNSFPTRKLLKSNLTQFLGGGLNAISGNIFGLCDFSVISKFQDNNKNTINGELKLVYENTEGNWSKNEITINSNPKLVDYNKAINGFTYRFKFYL